MSSGAALFSLSPPHHAFEYPPLDEATAAAAVVGGPQVVFDPVLPDAAALLGMAAILLLSIAAVRVWATQVVPVSRANLALSKRKGKVREYLDDLLLVDVDDGDGDNNIREGAGHAAARGAGSRDEFNVDAVAVGAVPTARSQSEELTDTLTDGEEAPASTEPIGQGRGRRRAFERWLFSDWLSQARTRNRDGPGRAGRQKDPAIPIVLPNAKWNSGDNPVLAASALIAMGVVASAIVEKLMLPLLQ
jgi:hypothetical protein